MTIARKVALATLLAAGLAGCSSPEETNTVAANEAVQANAAASIDSTNVEAAATNTAAAPADSFTAKGTFVDFLQGDYLYANFDGLTGHEAQNQAMVEKGELAVFLAAHKGKAMTVTIATTNRFMDPPGEKIDVVSLEDASVDGQSAADWWKALSPAEQKAAEKVADDMAAASVEH